MQCGNLQPQDEIWRPDAALQNAFKKFEGLGSSHLKVHVFESGEVLWYPYQILESACDVDITYFPFDVQECPFKITAWSYTEKIIGSSVEQEKTGDTTIIFKIKMKRKPSHIVINIIIPLLLLSFLADLTFLLPVTSGERASYAITSFLSVAVFLTIISSELPSSSDNVPIISIYLTILCFESTAIVVVSLFQLRYANDQPVNGCIKIIYSIIMAIRCKTWGKKTMETTEMTKSNPYHG
ncbi:ACHA7-like protein [Mya arenaria]|uniref:ACHA7-like protein n=1 Tax=Mya arenaria TaxID=6604 RepID=A0ABY7E8U4_MYAAR|nr:ACHA7-like protein [Mya arenaria]